MEKDKTKVENLIIDANVILSCLAKEQGFTRACFVMIKNQNTRISLPKDIYDEIKLYTPLISRKSNININILKLSMQELLKDVAIENEKDFKEHINAAKELVNDENDTTLVALALKIKPCTIVTFNTKDFKINDLKNLEINVLTPHQTLKERFNIDMQVVKSKIEKKGLNFFVRALMSWLQKI